MGLRSALSDSQIRIFGVSDTLTAGQQEMSLCGKLRSLGASGRTRQTKKEISHGGIRR